MARDKEYEARMQGMIYALNKAKTEGVEALERDIRKRNITKIVMNVPEKEMDRIFAELGENVRHTVSTLVFMTLYDEFGFGKVRLHRFKEHLNKLFNDIFDLDYMGEHYIRLEDFAIEMNEKYDMGLDLRRIIVCQELSDKDNPKYRMCKVDRVIKELREAGYKDAAGFLESKIY